MANDVRNAPFICCLPFESPPAEDHSVRLATLFQALGDSSRINFLVQIVAKKTCITETLVTNEIDPSRAVKDLNVLSKAGLVQGVVDGAKPCFCINREAFSVMMEFLRGFV